MFTILTFKSGNDSTIWTRTSGKDVTNCSSPQSSAMLFTICTPTSSKASTICTLISGNDSTIWTLPYNGKTHPFLTNVQFWVETPTLCIFWLHTQMAEQPFEIRTWWAKIFFSHYRVFVISNTTKITHLIKNGHFSGVIIMQTITQVGIYL